MRLIDADALIKNFFHVKKHDEAYDFFKAVYDAPTIDAVSREDYISMERTLARLQQGIADATDIVDTLPTIDRSKGEWIPVTEQKPHCWCLVTDVHRNVPFVARGIVTVGEDCIDGETLNTLNIDLFTGEKLPIEDLKKIIHGNRIIAWMPLPEPYKGGEDE